jgi:alpha-galactosidase
MSDLPSSSNRREFLGGALKLGAGSLLLGSALRAETKAADPAQPVAAGGRGAPMPTQLADVPTRVLVDHDGSGLAAAKKEGAYFTTASGAVELARTVAGLAVKVTCPTGLLTRVVLRWEMTFPDGALFLGDHWERGYGDLEWRGWAPDRVMPWYVATHDGALTHCYGVQTQPAALCFWQVDPHGISLWADVRSGSVGVELGTRELDVCRVISRPGSAVTVATPGR